MKRPETSEFFEYYNTYVSLVPGDDVMPILDEQSNELRAIFASVPEEKGAFAYELGKWTIKELPAISLTANAFAYRILRISRGDETPIEGFEQDGHIEHSNANSRPFADLLNEFDFQRRSNMLMLRNISDENSRLMGTASDKPVSVRALAYIAAGHVTHHINILKERYLV